MSNSPLRKSRPTRYLLWLLVPALLSAATVLFLWQAHPELDYWTQYLHDVRTYLEAHPMLLIFILATLPGLGFPISPLLILTGIVLAPRYGLAATCAIAVSAQVFCSIWTYALAVGPLREYLKRRVLRKWNPPDLTDRNALRLGLIIRITPGIPYCLQNIALGVIGLRFKTYLIASVPVMAVVTTGFVLTSGAIFQGKAGLALTGALLLVVVVLATRILRNRTKTHVR